MFGATAVRARRGMSGGNQRVSHVAAVPKYRNDLGGFPSDFWALEVEQNPLGAYVAFGQGVLSCAGAIL